MQTLNHVINLGDWIWGCRQGAYDLTVLDNMDGAFPPKRTSANIYRDNRYDKTDGGVRGSMDFGETRDSLDRLAVSTSDGDRQRLARCAGVVGF